MRRPSLVAVVFLAAACGQPPAPQPPAPPPPTLADEVDAMCACKTPACADQTHRTFAAAESTTSQAPHDQALREQLARCDTSAREPDELATMRAIDDAVCACKDAACVAAVHRDYADFMRREEHKYKRGPAPPADLMKAAEHAASCMSAVVPPRDGSGVGVGGSSRPPTSAVRTNGPTGVAACDEYLRAFDLYLQCDKIPQEAIDASKPGIEQMKEGWKVLKDPKVPQEALDAASDACAQATEALKQSAAAMGCPL